MLKNQHNPRRNLADATVSEVRAVALDLLARREHSQFELKYKLTVRSCPEQLVLDVTTQLASEGLQSDKRFAESFVRSRMAKGQGPIKIKAEFQARGIEDEISNAAINLYESDWLNIGSDAVIKKFGGKMQNLEYEEKAKQMRFLQARGFTSEQIRLIMKQQLETSID